MVSVAETGCNTVLTWRWKANSLDVADTPRDGMFAMLEADLGDASLRVMSMTLFRDAARISKSNITVSSLILGASQ